MANKVKRPDFIMVMIIYLAGIFMGAIDTGIVTPARTVIQNNLMVDDKTGIWMITIYTLAYAASIPVMGKMADKFGRKYIYLTSILLFGLGSLLSGLSQDIGSFSFLLFGRVVQAFGGGGIMPVATAEFGTTFPEEKRGMALGLVGGVYGVANIFGASAGSAILDIFGQNNWQFIFYLNLPITLFIVITGIFILRNNRTAKVRKTDIPGIILLTAMVLSLLYGLRNIDFFHFSATAGKADVYMFVLIFAVLLPFFILAERKAEDPVINLSYFTSQRILVTLILSFIVGIIMMGMIFVPQFSENALKKASGSGGYFVIVLGLFAGAGAPVSGKLIDKFGAGLILAAGFLISAAGAIFLAFVAVSYPNTFTVIISLVLIGLGMGFTIGTPLNYMMLENTKKEEANSALAALSLVRSVGTVIAPAIMVGFIAHAGANMQTNMTDLFPKQVTVPELPYAKELTAKINNFKKDPGMKDKMANMDIPDLASMTSINIDMGGNGSYRMPKRLIELMKGSDVTTIVKNSKVLAGSMFDEITPGLIKDIQSGVQIGIDGLQKTLQGMDMSLADTYRISNGAGMNGMDKAVASINSAKKDMQDTIFKMNVLKDAVPGAFEAAKANYLKKIDDISPKLEDKFQRTLNNGFKQVYLTVVITSLLALLILLFYKKEKSHDTCMP